MKCIAVFLFAAAVAGSCLAQSDVVKDSGSELTISAEASVTSEPDIAEFHLSIVARRPLATEAFKVYESTYETLVSSIGKVIDTSSLKTTSLSVTASYNEKNPDQTTPAYYQVYSAMSLTVSLSKLNEALGMITTVEGVAINGIDFRVSDQDSLQTLALGKAVIKARMKAETIARLEHLTGLRVKTMTTSFLRPPVPFYGARMAALEAAPTLNASDVTISATVNVTYSADAK